MRQLQIADGVCCCSSERVEYYTQPYLAWFHTRTYTFMCRVSCPAHSSQSHTYCLSFMKYKFHVCTLASRHRWESFTIKYICRYDFFGALVSVAHHFSVMCTHYSLSLVAICQRYAYIGGGAGFAWLQMCVRRSYIIEFRHMCATECCRETASAKEFIFLSHFDLPIVCENMSLLKSCPCFSFRFIAESIQCLYTCYWGNTNHWLFPVPNAVEFVG